MIYFINFFKNQFGDNFNGIITVPHDSLTLKKYSFEELYSKVVPS